MDGTTSRNFVDANGDGYTVDFDYIIYPSLDGYWLDFIGLTPKEKVEATRDLDLQTLIMEREGYRMNGDGQWWRTVE